jgi:flagellar biosynthesis protein FliR
VFLVDIFRFLSKTVTTLNLKHNLISNKGAKALADAFREIKVNIFFSFVFLVHIFNFLA